MDTQQVLDWFKGIIRCENRDEIQSRQQETVYQYLTTNSDDDLAEFGELSWDDWRSFRNVRRTYPPPAIDQENVDWLMIGKYLVQELNLELLLSDGSLWEEEEKGDESPQQEL